MGDDTPNGLLMMSQLPEGSESPLHCNQGVVKMGGASLSLVGVFGVSKMDRSRVASLK